MTLRSRKKPQTTVPILTATETSAPSSCMESAYIGFRSDDSQLNWCENPRRKTFSNATVIAIAFVLVSIGFVFPVGAETPTESWTPARPKQTLADAKVPMSKQQREWRTPSRLENTSKHLNWGVKRQEPAKAQAKPPQKRAAAPRELPIRTQTVSQKKTLQPKKQPGPQQKSVQQVTHISGVAPEVIAARSQERPRRIISLQPKMAAPSKPTVQGGIKSVLTTPPRIRRQSDGTQKVAMQAAAKPKGAEQAVAEPTVTEPKVAKQAVAKSTAREPELAKPAAKLIAVKKNIANQEFAQHELRLPVPRRPLSEVRHKRLLRNVALGAEGSGSKGFSAPSPDDIFTRGTDAQAQTRARRLQFKDQTPTTETIEVQSRFDSPFDSPSETMPEPTQAAEPIDFDDFDSSSSAESPTIDPSLFDTPTNEPETNSDSLPPSFDSLPDAPAGVANSSDATSSGLESPEEMNRRLKERLQKLENLPNLNNGEEVPGSGIDLGSDNTGSGNATSNSPLFSDKEPSENGGKSVGDLSFTNGRDTEANAEACRADLRYIQRRQRTDFSLNITPSIAPNEVDMGKVEETRIEKLAKAPLNTWKDREGNIIADGNLENFSNDKVTVLTVNGTRRTLPFHRLSDRDRAFVESWWELPNECNFEGEQYKVRDFRLTTFTWVAAGTCHKPLYFDQVGVERYGHSSGPIVQPLVSGVHFFGDIVMLPYHFGVNPPNECQYTLGYYRPGDCAPWLVPGFPFSKRGFKWEGLALGAAIALLP